MSEHRNNVAVFQSARDLGHQACGILGADYTLQEFASEAIRERATLVIETFRNRGDLTPFRRRENTGNTESNSHTKKKTQPLTKQKAEAN